MAISYLSEGDAITVAQANEVFDALDDALWILFNGQSPLLYKPYSGASSYSEAGLAGVRFVFGTKANRKIFSSVDSHDQPAIDAAVAAATILDQYDTLKQIELDLASGYLSNSLVAQKREVTPPTGPNEDYWAKVEFLTGYYHHEKIHELAVADVIFEGHAGRTFTWLEEWNKFRCIRFHNLDSDATDLVVTMEETSDTITLPRWSCKTVRRSADGASWAEDGFLLWRMREDDLERFGGVMPWNDRRRATSGATSDSVWTSDGANNVASWALVWWLIDYFSTPQTPAEVDDYCGDGVQGAYDAQTGLAFDLSDITRNAWVLPPYPDSLDDDTPIYQLAWHGGQMLVWTYHTDTTSSWASGSPTIANLLSGDAATGLTLEVDVGGNSAHLKLTTETGKDFADVVPIGSNIGASGNPFTITADGVGYTVPYAQLFYPTLYRLSEASGSETVLGIGTSETTAYTFADDEASNDGSETLKYFEATIGDANSWTFADSAISNDHCTATSNSLKWDGRKLALNFKLEFDPVNGAVPTDGAVERLLSVGSVLSQESVLNWFQHSLVMAWPPTGGIWLTPNYARRSKPVVDDALYLANPHVTDYLGTASGEDWVAISGTSWPIPYQIKRQLPHGDLARDAELTTTYLEAPDSMRTIVANRATAGWWASNRSGAIAGTVLSGETRDVIAVPIMARHFNVLAQRLNALLMVTPFSFFDCVYYGEEFRPDYSDGGIFEGHYYPIGFVCYSTGSAASRAAALGLTVRDFRTEITALALADADVYGRYGGGTTGDAFISSLGTGFNFWNADLIYWFNPNPPVSVGYNEPTRIDTASPGAGWTVGELAYSVGATDFYWYSYANDSSYDCPDFAYITIAEVATLAASLGLPLRFLRLSATWDVNIYNAARVGLGGRVVPIVGGGTATRTAAILQPDGTAPQFQCFAGTNELWAGKGVVRISDWPPSPATQWSDITSVKRSLADPMHGLNRSGSGDVVLRPYGYTPATGTPDGSWANGDPFSGEARFLMIEHYDTCPTPPTGWGSSVPRLGSYPVPITEWGASDIESHAAPACDPKWIDVSLLPSIFDCEDLWAEQGSGAWTYGTGAFVVHLVPQGLLAP